MVEFQKTTFADEVLLFFDNRIDVEIAAYDEALRKHVRRFNCRQPQRRLDDAFAEIRIVAHLLAQFIGHTLENLQHEFIDNRAIRKIEIDDADFFFELRWQFKRRAQ